MAKLAFDTAFGATDTLLPSGSRAALSVPLPGISETCEAKEEVFDCDALYGAALVGCF